MIGRLRQRVALLVVFVCAAGISSLLAQDPDNAAVLPESAKAGKLLFQQSCGFCHGPDGRGASGPDLLRSSLVSHDEGANLIGPVVRNGRPDKGMPSFPFSDSQIQQIVQFLHAESKMAATITRRNAADYPLEKLLVGDRRAGEAYFRGAGKCSSCHSPTGDLAQIASKYKPIELQSRIAYPGGARPHVVVTDSTGEKYEGDEVYSDEFVITVKNAKGWTRSWNRKLVKLESHDPLEAHEKLLPQYSDKILHDLFAYLVTLK